MGGFLSAANSASPMVSTTSPRWTRGVVFDEREVFRTAQPLLWFGGALEVGDQQRHPMHAEPRRGANGLRRKHRVKRLTRFPVRVGAKPNLGCSKSADLAAGAS